MLYSGPEGLENADFNVTVLWTAIQILQFFITWINEPSQINTPHYWPFWFSVKCAEFMDPMEENGNSKYSCTYSAVLYQKFILLTVTQLA